MIPITGVTQAEVLVERIWPIERVARIGAEPERHPRRPPKRPARPFDPEGHHLDVRC